MTNIAGIRHYLRIERVMIALMDGWSRKRIVEEFSPLFGVSTRQIDRYIAQARAAIAAGEPLRSRYSGSVAEELHILAYKIGTKLFLKAGGELTGELEIALDRDIDDHMTRIEATIRETIADQASEEVEKS